MTQNNDNSDMTYNQRTLVLKLREAQRHFRYGSDHHIAIDEAIELVFKTNDILHTTRGHR
jgi:hypothetical protein